MPKFTVIHEQGLAFGGKNHAKGEAVELPSDSSQVKAWVHFGRIKPLDDAAEKKRLADEKKAAEAARAAAEAAEKEAAKAAAEAKKKAAAEKAAAAKAEAEKNKQGAEGGGQ